MPSIRRSFFVELVAPMLVMLLLGADIAVNLRPVQASERTSTIGIAPLLVSQSAAQTAVALGTGTMTSCRESAVYIQWSAASASGAVQIETAHDVNYTGTWAPLGSPVSWSANTREDVIQITGVHGAIRTRISTIIGSGTVSTWVVCN